MPASVSDIQRRLGNLDPKSDNNYPPLLHELLSHQDLKPHVQNLHGPDLEGFIELLDKALNHIPITNDLFRKTLCRLQSICGNCGILPQSCVIQGERLSDKGQPIASGGFADVYAAEFDGKRVCVKVLRLYVQDTRGVMKKAFYREVVVWRRLQHPNIVPFLGVVAKIPPFKIVCQWMENGRITEYARKCPDVDHVDLLWDVADGLHYLHSCDVIHGDLKGANILIDKDGHALITDFGLTFVTQGEYSVASAQDHNTTTSLAAPEILVGGPVSKEGDVFAFAMVAVETFTGHPPFVNNYQAAVFDILTGKHPQRPVNLNHEGLWEIMKTCWSRVPKERPTTSQLLEFFRESFPSRRDTAIAQSLPSMLSTWSLATAAGDVDGYIEPRPDPHGRDELGGGESGPQDPSVRGELQDRSKHTTNDLAGRNGMLSLPSEDQSTLFQRVIRKAKKFMKRFFSRETPK